MPVANVPADSEHSLKGAECWSDFVFDLLLADELEHVRVMEVRNHLLACDRCRRRFEGLKRFRDEAQLPVLDWTGRRPEGSPRGAWLTLAAGTIAAAAGALLWIRSAPPPSSVPWDETRSKGAGRLGFYVKR